MAESVNTAETKSLNEIRQNPPKNPTYIVPRKMKARKGLTRDGAISARCKANTGKATYIVVEKDGESNKDTQSAVLWHLGEYLPLTMVVDSGNESLHGWYYSEGILGEREEAFRKYACELGLDPSIHSPCQLVRTPNAFRDNGNKQVVVYLNPGKIGKEGDSNE